jgi:hypothetical protein
MIPCFCRNKRMKSLARAPVSNNNLKQLTTPSLKLVILLLQRGTINQNATNETKIETATVLAEIETIDGLENHPWNNPIDKMAIITFLHHELTGMDHRHHSMIIITDNSLHHHLIFGMAVLHRQTTTIDTFTHLLITTVDTMMTFTINDATTPLRHFVKDGIWTMIVARIDDAMTVGKQVETDDDPSHLLPHHCSHRHHWLNLLSKNTG